MNNHKVPGNHELHIMLVKMDGKMDTIIDGQKTVEAWQNKHEKADKESFLELHKRISSMRMYGNSIAIVAGGISAACIWIWKKIGGI